MGKHREKHWEKVRFSHPGSEERSLCTAVELGRALEEAWGATLGEASRKQMEIVVE